MGKGTLTLSSPIDVSGYASADLTFDWLIENGFDSGEFLALDVSTNEGAGWQSDVRRLSGNVDAENTWHNESVDLYAFSSSNLLIRFRSTVSKSNENANVDNVKITASGASMSAMLAASASSPLKSEPKELALDKPAEIITPASAATLVPMQSRSHAQNVDSVITEIGTPSEDEEDLYAPLESRLRNLRLRSTTLRVVFATAIRVGDSGYFFDVGRCFEKSPRSAKCRVNFAPSASSAQSYRRSIDHSVPNLSRSLRRFLPY